MKKDLVNDDFVRPNADTQSSCPCKTIKVGGTLEASTRPTNALKPPKAASRSLSHSDDKVPVAAVVKAQSLEYDNKQSMIHNCTYSTCLLTLSGPFNPLKWNQLQIHFSPPSMTTHSNTPISVYAVVDISFLTFLNCLNYR